MKLCRLCNLSKPPQEFYVDRKRIGALHTYCIECCKKKSRGQYAAAPEKHAAQHKKWVAKNKEKVRIQKITSTFKITADEYLALAKVCVICGAVGRLCVDHSHQSGRVRGLLCHQCNKGLGMFRDNPALLARAADYVLGKAKPEIFAAAYEPEGASANAAISHKTLRHWLELVNDNPQDLAPRIAAYIPNA